MIFLSVRPFFVEAALLKRLPDACRSSVTAELQKWVVCVSVLMSDFLGIKCTTFGCS